MTRTLGLIARLTGFRFSKRHRYDNTWQYRYLNTVKINQIAGLK